MKVVVVGVSREIGGAAKATWRMFEGLTSSKGALCYEMYCSEGSKEKGDSIKTLPWKRGLWVANLLGGSGFTRKILDIKLRIWNCIMVNRRSRHQFFYTSSLVRKREIETKCSLIHYVWIQLIGSSFKATTTPYVVTLHDMWQLTGGCAYRLGCKEFEQGCSSCPEVRRFAREQVKTMKQKKVAFLNGAYGVVVTSEWMRDEAIKAGVYPEKIMKIENYIPEVFQYNRQNTVRKDEDWSDRVRKKRGRLYFVGSIKDNRKGFKSLVEALYQSNDLDLANWELSVLGCEDYELEEIRSNGIWARGYGVLRDDMSQAVMYNEADILICPSGEDNSPNVVAEAHCCGLPVVVIDKTGAAEMVEENLNGWVARDSSVKELGKTLTKAVSQHRTLNRVEIARQARSRYGKQNTIARYSELYLEAVLKND